MLLGRRDERLALDRLLAQAREGRSGVLALVGEPGIGKTALLEYAAERADGMRILRARGIESEAVIPFAGLAELLRPALGALDRIPAPQATALAGALALGPARARDRFAVGAATLSLLSASAEEGPLALLVDDAHWLDRSSAETLLFAARRLLADPIALVLTVREGEPSLLDGADLRTLRMAGLDRLDAAELLSRLDIPDDAVERLYPRHRRQPARAARARARGRAPGPRSQATRRFRSRRASRRVPAPLRAAARADPSRARARGRQRSPALLAVLARAASSLGLDIGDLAAAEEAGLVTVGPGEVEFTHPLARAAMYADAAAQERREAHAALARGAPRPRPRPARLAPGSSQRRPRRPGVALRSSRPARGRASAAPTRSPPRRSNAPPACASTDDAREQLLFAAAQAAWLAGDAPRTLALLEDAQAHAASRRRGTHRPPPRPGGDAMRAGHDGYPLIVGAAGQIADADPELAVVMLAQAVHGCFYTGDTPAMIAAAERAVALADGQDSRRATFFAVDGARHGTGRRRPRRGRRRLGTRRRSRSSSAQTSCTTSPELLAWAALGPLWLREAKAGRGLIERAFERARAQRGRSAPCPACCTCSRATRRPPTSGRRPRRATTKRSDSARETGQRVELAASLAGLAWLRGTPRARGRLPRTRRRGDRRCAMSSGIALYGVWAIQALGDLELGLGRPAAAIEHYEAQIGCPEARAASPTSTFRRRRSSSTRSCASAATTMPPVPPPISSHRRQRRANRGRWPAPLAAAGSSPTRASSSPASRKRCDSTSRRPDVFETARTRLAYGARLRRARKRIRAREQLRVAAEIFERLGAQPWADAGRRRARGDAARRHDAAT